ncbi:MAG: Lar family restriction alleviation protein, partial [Deltaproteobacteria bacterium]|nr:Lar family restriction alleviation protein [Deltaproteobacteria bacterium]
MSGDKTATELLPCPFCGPGQSMVDPWYDDVSKRWAVGCGRCGSSSGRSIHADGSKEAAIKSWNTRAPAQCDVQTKEALHYLGAIKVRLELLYEHSTQDSR